MIRLSEEMTKEEIQKLVLEEKELAPLRKLAYIFAKSNDKVREIAEESVESSLRQMAFEHGYEYKDLFAIWDVTYTAALDAAIENGEKPWGALKTSMELLKTMRDF